MMTINWDFQLNGTGWQLHMSHPTSGIVFPRYRGSCEPNEYAPKRLRVISRINKAAHGGTSVSTRFRGAFSFGRHRNFAVSLEIPPEIWCVRGTRDGWHFFSHGEIHLGIWTSLPATWLAQDSEGKILEPPWKELWTYGFDHTWSAYCSIGNLEEFTNQCVRFSSLKPPCIGGNTFESNQLICRYENAYSPMA